MPDEKMLRRMNPLNRGHKSTVDKALAKDLGLETEKKRNR